MTYATKSPKKIAGLQQNAKKCVRANFASPEVARLLPRWLRAAVPRVCRGGLGGGAERKKNGGIFFGHGTVSKSAANLAMSSVSQ